MANVINNEYTPGTKCMARTSIKVGNTYRLRAGKLDSDMSNWLIKEMLATNVRYLFHVTKIHLIDAKRVFSGFLFIESPDGTVRAHECTYLIISSPRITFHQGVSKKECATLRLVKHLLEK